MYLPSRNADSYVMNMQLRASRRRDCLQQYAYAKSLQKFATKIFEYFFQLLQLL